MTLPEALLTTSSLLDSLTPLSTPSLELFSLHEYIEFWSFSISLHGASNSASGSDVNGNEVYWRYLKTALTGLLHFILILMAEFTTLSICDHYHHLLCVPKLSGLPLPRPPSARVRTATHGFAWTDMPACPTWLSTSRTINTRPWLTLSSLSYISEGFF